MVKLLINVVAAIFHDGDKVFATKRAYGSMKDLWEFPGGKPEIGESLEDALKREIKEELSADIYNIIKRDTLSFEYPDFFIHLHVFDAEVDKDKLTRNPNIHSDCGWFNLDELKTLNWCPADNSLINEKLLEVKYKFFNASNATMKPINEAYGMIEDVHHLYDLLSECWGKESASKRLAPKWSKDNKTLAQCNPTSWIVQDIFGGEVLGTPIGNGVIHAFNMVNGIVFDLTSEQFHGKSVNYEDCVVLDRDETFAAEPEKEERYKTLKLKLDNLLSK